MHAMISSFIFFVFLAILSAQEPLYLQLQPTNQYISYGPTPPDAIRYQNTQTYDPSAQSYNQGQPLEDFSRIGLTRILITRQYLIPVGPARVYYRSIPNTARYTFYPLDIDRNTAITDGLSGSYKTSGYQSVIHPPAVPVIYPSNKE